jgi:hypothetical protein
MKVRPRVAGALKPVSYRNWNNFKGFGLVFAAECWTVGVTMRGGSDPQNEKIVIRDSRSTEESPKPLVRPEKAESNGLHEKLI